MRSKSFVFALILICIFLLDIGVNAQSLISLNNVYIARNGGDGSDALLLTEIPKKVGDVLTQSVGMAMLSQRSPCKSPTPRAHPCYHVKRWTTAFAVGDHEVLTNFHLVEWGVPINLGSGKVLAFEGKGKKMRKVRLTVMLFFRGEFYEGKFVNKKRVDGVDLALLRVTDPLHTWNIPAISIARKPLTRGFVKTYTLGFYRGCDMEEVEEAGKTGKDVCVTPGYRMFEVFKRYFRDSKSDEAQGEMLVSITWGLSGSPLLNEDAQLVGIPQGLDPVSQRTYFIPASVAQTVLQKLRGDDFIAMRGYPR